jgi:hypothetical protein
MLVAEYDGRLKTQDFVSTFTRAANSWQPDGTSIGNNIKRFDFVDHLVAQPPAAAATTLRSFNQDGHPKTGLDNDNVTPILITLDAATPKFICWKGDAVAAEAAGVGVAVDDQWDSQLYEYALPIAAGTQNTLNPSGKATTGAGGNENAYVPFDWCVCHGLIVAICEVFINTTGTTYVSSNIGVCYSQDYGQTWTLLKDWAEDVGSRQEGEDRGAKWVLQNWWPIEERNVPHKAVLCGVDYRTKSGNNPDGGMAILIYASRTSDSATWTLFAPGVAMDTVATGSLDPGSPTQEGLASGSGRHTHSCGIIADDNSASTLGFSVVVSQGDAACNSCIRLFTIGGITDWENIASATFTERTYTVLTETMAFFGMTDGTTTLEGTPGAQPVGIAPGRRPDQLLIGSDLSSEIVMGLSIDGGDSSTGRAVLEHMIDTGNDGGLYDYERHDARTNDEYNTECFQISSARPDRRNCFAAIDSFQGDLSAYDIATVATTTQLTITSGATDISSNFTAGDSIIIRNSTSNDGTYTVASSSYANPTTTVNLNAGTPLSDTTNDGHVEAVKGVADNRWRRLWLSTDGQNWSVQGLFDFGGAMAVACGLDGRIYVGGTEGDGGGLSYVTPPGPTRRFKPHLVGPGGQQQAVEEMTSNTKNADLTVTQMSAATLTSEGIPLPPCDPDYVWKLEGIPTGSSATVNYWRAMGTDTLAGSTDLQMVCRYWVYLHPDCDGASLGFFEQVGGGASALIASQTKIAQGKTARAAGRWYPWIANAKLSPGVSAYIPQLGFRYTARQANWKLYVGVERVKTDGSVGVGHIPGYPQEVTTLAASPVSRPDENSQLQVRAGRRVYADGMTVGMVLFNDRASWSTPSNDLNKVFLASLLDASGNYIEIYTDLNSHSLKFEWNKSDTGTVTVADQEFKTQTACIAAVSWDSTNIVAAASTSGERPRSSSDTHTAEPFILDRVRWGAANDWGTVDCAAPALLVVKPRFYGEADLRGWLRSQEFMRAAAKRVGTRRRIDSWRR